MISYDFFSLVSYYYLPTMPTQNLKYKERNFRLKRETKNITRENVTYLERQQQQH